MSLTAFITHKDCRITSYNVCYTKLLRIHTGEVEELIREWIEMLNDKQRLVVRHRYGLVV